MSAWNAANGRLGPAAVWYAEHGWKVMPCYGIENGRCTCGGTHAEPKDVGKHPSIPEWNTQATSNVDAVHRWWPAGNENNVSVFCRPSGFFVIDIDPRAGGPDSFEKFEALVDGALPPTVEAITGVYTMGGRATRGRHLFYSCNDSENLVGNLKKSGLNGIDIKHNGYVLIAPSRHFSGVCYEWVHGKAPWEIKIAQAPEELLATLRKRKHTAAASLGSGDWGFLDDLEWGGDRVDVDRLLAEGIDEGSRAVDIYSMTCALANKFPINTEAGKLAVETMMIRFNAEKVRPPLELEGQGGLLMHVHRAIQFVIDNPKSERMWPGLQEWAHKSQEETRARLATTTAATTTSLAAVSSMQSTQKPIQASSQLTTTNLPGTIGGSVSTSLEDGDSLSRASNLSNIDVPKDVDALGEEEGGEPGKRTLTDVGNGRRLIDSFGAAVRYTPGLGWFHWDGGYWKPDIESLEMRELSKKIAPIVASEVVHYLDDADKQSEVIKWAQQAKSNSRINGLIESATSDPRILIDVESWDSNETLLGVLNGVVDLRTGELLKGRPDLYITRRAPVAYNPGIRNIRWEQFIDFATGGDKELQEWLQKAAGYSLTGLRTYDVMFMVYGPSGSGKNTMVEALVKAMGTSQYAWPLDSSILAQGDGQAHGADLYHWAELRGRRMVWVDELPDGERIKENSIKKLTGSSEISARSPGEKPFTFQSRAKLWVTTNHRPIITDDAMWRRIRPVPLLNVPENPDPDLKHYIFDPEGALPAVLSWAVEGAIKLLGSSARDGLGWCKAVSDAAEIYRKNEDRIGFFLSEETKEAEHTATPIKSLYAVYRAWSEERGEKPMTQIAFQRKLSDRGLQIEGHGSKAQIIGRLLLPRSVSTGEIDWGTAQRFAR